MVSQLKHRLGGIPQRWPSLTRANRLGMQDVLSYDRPDIILVDGDTPILVVEETVEVPSGHNVGQRFARIAAAAQGWRSIPVCSVPMSRRSMAV